MLGAADFKSSDTMNRCIIGSEVVAKLSGNIFEAYSSNRDKIDGGGCDGDDDAGESSFDFFHKFILSAATTFL